MQARIVYSVGEAWRAEQSKCVAFGNVKMTDLDYVQSHRKTDSLVIVGHLLLYNFCALVASLPLSRLISYLVG